MTATPAMDGIETQRLQLVPLSLDEAFAMVNGHRPVEDRWAADYPTDASLVAAGLVVTAEAEGRELGPFTAYQIVCREDGRAVGGCGFIEGGPDPAGHVHVSFSLVDSARGHGYASEALAAIIAFAKDQPGVTRVLAETAGTNTSRIAVFEDAGMRRAGSDGELVFFEA
jgi:RimJ/RimL family protein N-acetyltransferase